MMKLTLGNIFLCKTLRIFTFWLLHTTEGGNQATWVGEKFKGHNIFRENWGSTTWPRDWYTDMTLAIDSFINLDQDLSEFVKIFGTDEASVRIWKTP